MARYVLLSTLSIFLAACNLLYKTEITPHFFSTFSTQDPCKSSYSFISDSEFEINGEYIVVVNSLQIDCRFSFTVSGGGSTTVGTSYGGNGGINSFEFTPQETGVFKIVVGGAGENSNSMQDGAPGGGASSVIFDPDQISDESDAFTLSIAGGGAGSSRNNLTSGHGNGDGMGGGTGNCLGGAANGQGGFGEEGNGGSCLSGLCRGGQGGDNLTFSGGHGKGSGWGKAVTFAGSSGGGYGGGGGGKWGSIGCGGSGEVFSHIDLINTTDLGITLGGGSAGGSSATIAEDGYVFIISE